MKRRRLWLGSVLKLEGEGRDFSSLGARVLYYYIIFYDSIAWIHESMYFEL